MCGCLVCCGWSCGVTLGKTLVYLFELKHEGSRVFRTSLASVLLKRLLLLLSCAREVKVIGDAVT